MATLTQFLPFDQNTLGTFKPWAQGVGNAFSTFGWLPVTDSGVLNTTGNYGTAAISSISVQNNVLLVNFTGPTNSFAQGQVVQLTGLTTNTFLNNQFVRITNNINSQSGALTGAATSFSLTSVAASVGNTAVYTGTITLGANNFFQNVVFVVAGFTTTANNGTFVCTASTATTLTLYNAAAAAETHAATATPNPDRTTTYFTALFVHADVGTFSTPTADTGTVTGLLNWNTVSAPPDTIAVNQFNVTAPYRMRGSWVGVTPIFTQLQTTNNQTTLSFGTNGHGFDLTRSVGLGLRITNIQNANFTWLNDSATGLPSGSGATATAGWPIVSLTSTTVVINTQGSPRADIAATPVAAGFAAAYYIGSTGNPSVSDVVFYGGDLYVQLKGTAGGVYGFQGSGGGGSSNGSGTGAQPGTDITQWKKFWLEGWQSNDALSSTNKIFVRLLYGSTGSALPTWFIYAGTGTDGNGNINQNSIWQTTAPTSILSTSISAESGAALWECDFSGDSGRFGCIMWRTYNVGPNTPAVVINIERAHDNSGNNLDSYWTVLWNQAQTINGQCSVLKASTGGAAPLNTNSFSTIKSLPTSVAQSFNNSIAVLPVFPMIGYVANPMIGIVGMNGGDAAEGAFITTSFYGTVHTYLMSKSGSSTTGGPGNFGPVSPAGGGACAIRWE